MPAPHEPSRQVPDKSPPADTGSGPAPASRRTAPLTALAIGVTGIGVVIAVTRPAWLVTPLQAAVADATAAPLVFVALCVLSAPFHLNGVVVVMSPLFWPLPAAAALSFAGTFLGCLLTAALLARLGLASGARGDWPPWLTRLSGTVTRRPLLIGIAVRVVLCAGFAVEAFYALTGYSRRQYLVVTTLGIAGWVIQALLGVTLLTAAVAVFPAPAVGVVLVILPLALLGGALAWRRRRPVR